MLVSNFEQMIVAYVCAEPNKMPDHLFNYKATESRSNVFEFDIPHYSEWVYGEEKKLVNPCQKPVPLLRHLIRHFSKSGSWIIDLCAGTGTNKFIKSSFFF